MMNKILVFWWLALSAILIVENMVTWMTAYVFIDSWAQSWFLSFVSIIVWILIWFWLKWMFEKENGDNDNYDF
jgi:uncharacterized membrane protein